MSPAGVVLSMATVTKPAPPSALAFRDVALPVSGRHTVVAAVLGAHLALGWSLLQITPLRQVAGAVTPVFVRLVTPGQALAAPPAALSTATSALPPQPRPARPGAAPPRAPRPALPDNLRRAAPATLTANIAPAARPDAPAVQADAAATMSQPAMLAAASAPAPATPATSAPAPPTPVAPAPIATTALQRTIAAAAVRYIVAPQPAYSAASRRLGEAGEVHVRVEIGTDGRARHVVLQRSSGFARLDHSALAAVRATLFLPFTENGVTLVVWTVVPIVFELQAANT